MVINYDTLNNNERTDPGLVSAKPIHFVFTFKSTFSNIICVSNLLVDDNFEKYYVEPKYLNNAFKLFSRMFTNE